MSHRNEPGTGTSARRGLAPLILALGMLATGCRDKVTNTYPAAASANTSATASPNTTSVAASGLSTGTLVETEPLIGDLASTSTSTTTTEEVEAAGEGPCPLAGAGLPTEGVAASDTTTGAADRHCRGGKTCRHHRRRRRVRRRRRGAATLIVKPVGRARAHRRRRRRNHTDGSVE